MSMASVALFPTTVFPALPQPVTCGFVAGSQVVRALAVAAPVPPINVETVTARVIAMRMRHLRILPPWVLLRGYDFASAAVGTPTPERSNSLSGPSASLQELACPSTWVD